MTADDLVSVVNIGSKIEHIGSQQFAPNEVARVTKDTAAILLKIPVFALVPSSDEAASIITQAASPESTSNPLAEIRHCFWPEPTCNLQGLTDRAFPFNHPVLSKTKHPLSLLWVIHGIYPPYGGIRVIGRLMYYLKQRGHNVGFTTMLHHHENVIEDLYVNAREKDFEPDVTIGTYFETIIAAKDMPGNKVGFIQGDEPAWPEGHNRNQAKKAFNLPGWKYITIAPHLQKTCRESYDSNVIGTVNGNGVDCFDYSPRLNHFKPRRTAFTIIRSVSWKGWPVVEKVFSTLRSDGIRTTACGFEQLSSPLLDTYVQEPSVPEMAMLYSEADVYFSASQFEGSPLTPLEAMACGCIPIVTPIGADYVKHGVNGFIAESPDAMLQCANMVFNDPQLKWDMVQEGLRTARQRTWETVGREFEALLERV